MAMGLKEVALLRFPDVLDLGIQVTNEGDFERKKVWIKGLFGGLRALGWIAKPEKNLAVGLPLEEMAFELTVLFQKGSLLTLKNFEKKKDSW